MSLSTDLISQFVKATKDTTKQKNEAVVYGTVVTSDGRKYVRIDGSNLLTPVATTTDVEDDERVTVMIKDHSAVITGNLSSPSVRKETVEELSDEISEFETLIAYSITTEDLEAVNAVIDNLRVIAANISDADIINAEIENLAAKYADLEYVTADDIEALTADIDKIQAAFIETGELSAEDLEAMNADIDNLKAYNANFTYVSVEVLEAMKADIKQLDVDKLSVDDAAIKYANIDFANIGEAAITNFYAKSGIIKDLVISDGTITGELVGVTIKGDLIEGGTVKADKLVVLGSDGLYYKLNTEGGVTSSETVTEEELQNGLHGDVLIKKSIVAEKIAVDDLVAFGATIGGFNITEDSLYSGAKESVDNTTRGIYLDDAGQIAFGDSSNYLKYYKNDKDVWILDIKAGSIKMGASEKTVETIIEEIQTDVDSLRDEITTLLHIESSRGLVFKNSGVSTILSIVIYHGNQRITDSDTMKSIFGDSAYLEWKWQRLNDETYGVISASDSRFMDNGFKFVLSPDDVDAKIDFMCDLIV